MNGMTSDGFLTGHLLIAMPAMQDPNFNQTVTFLCEHNEQGALGIVINRPLDMDMGMIFEQLSLETGDTLLSRQPVLSGGPVQQERGFVLHDAGPSFDSTVQVSPEVAITTSQDILDALARGDGPLRAIVALGYAGWAAGQLETEMAANAWLSVPATPELLFDTAYEQRWAAAARLLGVDISRLGSEAGHA